MRSHTHLCLTRDESDRGRRGKGRERGGERVRARERESKEEKEGERSWIRKRTMTVTTGRRAALT